MKTDNDSKTTTDVVIKPPRFGVAAFTIRGNAPFVSNNFSQEAINMMKKGQEEGGQKNKKKTREPKDFQKKALGSLHTSTEGWHGFSAAAIRTGLIDACRLVNFKMTYAKLSVFVEQDSFDRDSGTPLIKFTKGKPHYCEHFVRLATGSSDIMPRMMWDPGWEAVVRIRWDEDQFSATDVANLLARVGAQVGIGAGRPNSKTSCGMGWGTFDLINKA